MKHLLVKYRKAALLRKSCNVDVLKCPTWRIRRLLICSSNAFSFPCVIILSLFIALQVNQQLLSVSVHMFTSYAK